MNMEEYYRRRIEEIDLQIKGLEELKQMFKERVQKLFEERKEAEVTR